MTYRAETRDRYRRLVTLGTGVIATGSLVATGALVAVAENEAVAKQAAKDSVKAAQPAEPVVRQLQRDTRTKLKVVTRPGGGSVAAAPSGATARTVVRVVRRVTKSSGS